MVYPSDLDFLQIHSPKMHENFPSANYFANLYLLYFFLGEAGDEAWALHTSIEFSTARSDT